MCLGVLAIYFVDIGVEQLSIVSVCDTDLMDKRHNFLKMNQVASYVRMAEHALNEIYHLDMSGCQ